MESDQWAIPIALILFTALMAITSAGHAAWPRLNRGRLKHLASEGVEKAPAVLRLVEASSNSTLIALTIANAACIALVAAFGVALASRDSGGNLLLFGVVVVIGGAFVLWVQAAADAVGHLHPDSTVLSLLLPIQAVTVLLTPITALMRSLTRSVVRVDVHQALENGHSTDEDLRMIVDAVEEEGALEQEEREMIHSIFEMGDTTAREIMVPRVDIFAVEASEPLRSVLEVVKERGHSRIPIYEQSIDNIVGIVYAKDLLRHMEAGSLDDPARVLGRPPHFIPESKKTDELLREMQREKVHIAVILDEYGGTAGIVTIEDLLEEIVGEIQDEYDAEEIAIEMVGDHEAVFDARVSIRDVNEALDLSLEDGEYDTLGGLVYDRLGKIPVVGDEVVFDGLQLTVLSTLGKRIKKVKIRVEPEATQNHVLYG